MHSITFNHPLFLDISYLFLDIFYLITRQPGAWDFYFNINNFFSIEKK
jgi:hypothetical protein